MDKVKLVRIRWKQGTERINVTQKDTIGTLIDYMVKKYGISDKDLTLTQEKTKTIYQKRTKLASVDDIENGELFILLLPSDQKSTSIQQKSAQQKPKTPTEQEFRPSTAKSQKREWGENVKTVSELSAMHPTIKYVPPKDCKVKRIWFPVREIEPIRKIANALHFNSTRVFLLYGTHKNDESFSVHAISMPSQDYDGKNITLNENHIKSSNDLALIMGLDLIGVMLIGPKSDVIFPAPLFLSFIQLQGIKSIENLVLIRVSPSLTTLQPDGIPIQLEAYVVSEQFAVLYKDGLFTGETTHNLLYTKERITAGGKIGKEVDVSFFITPVPIKQRVGWFPRCSFPYQGFYPTISDFIEVMEKDFEVPNYVRLLDFNLLLYLENFFSKDKDLPLIVRKCIAKEEMPDNVLVKIDETVDTPLRKRNK